MTTTNVRYDGLVLKNINVNPCNEMGGFMEVHDMGPMNTTVVTAVL